MVATYEAGTVFVQVVPSLRDFHKTIQRDLKGLETRFAGLSASATQAATRGG